MECKEIQPVHSKGDQSWVFFGKNDAKAETPVHWPPHVKSWLIGKDSDAGRDGRQEEKRTTEEEKGTTEDEMVGWHHRLDGQGFRWTPGVGDGQGGLACCNSWGSKELDTTEWLNWTEWHIEMGYVQGLEDFIFLHCHFSPNWFLESMKYLSKSYRHFFGKNWQTYTKFFRDTQML